MEREDVAEPKVPHPGPAAVRLAEPFQKTVANPERGEHGKQTGLAFPRMVNQDHGRHSLKIYVGSPILR